MFGFSSVPRVDGAKEVEEAGEAGITYLSLGARILRTETAGIVAASLVLYESGDLG